MQAQITKQSYAVSSYTPQSAIKGLVFRLQQLGGSLVRVLAPQDSLHVQSRELNGQTIWTVSDRISQTRYEFTSEAALRTWLEERYYQ